MKETNQGEPDWGLSQAILHLMKKRTYNWGGQERTIQKKSFV